jgi:beta-glucanase (GH16 family)
MAFSPDRSDGRRRRWRLAAAALACFIVGWAVAAQLPLAAVSREAMPDRLPAGSAGSAATPGISAWRQGGTSRPTASRQASAPAMPSPVPQGTPGTPEPTPGDATQTPAPQASSPQPTATPGPASLQPDGIPGAWSLTLNVGPTELAKWGGWFGAGLTGPVNKAEDACYSRANITVSGKYLDMALTSQPARCHGRPEPYTGALLSSLGKFDQAYGAFEARIDVPATPGGAIADWPAFWLDGTGHWPVTGEIDVMEGLLGRTCYHFHYQQDGAPAGPGGCTGTGPGWHTFAAVWAPGSVTYYYDGAEVGVITSGITRAPMYLILDLTDNQQGGGSRVIPATMRVAYVRAWSGSAQAGP